MGQTYERPPPPPPPGSSGLRESDRLQERQARALETIAASLQTVCERLDRMEDHLLRIAEKGVRPPGMGPL